MDPKPTTTRRQFIATTTAAAAGFTIVPRHVLGGPRFVAPSDKVNVAIIGAGGQGRTNARALFQEEDCQIIALADPAEEWDLAQWYYTGKAGRGPVKAEVEQHYAAKTPNHTCAVYEDFRVMLEREKAIDAVLIATPDHLHAYISILAMKSGKHVYCEKPLTHNIREARLVARVAKETGVATQMGNFGRSGEGHRQTVEWIKDGAIGAVKALACVGLIWLAYVGSLWLLGVPERDAALRSFFVTAFMAVGAVAAYVIEHSLRYSYLYNRLAMHHADFDPLTGIANRRKFMTDFARLWRLAERERRSLAVCLVDVDSFKAYNDCYGHIEGDRVLARVAAALRDACQRPLDICARYGGEEFIIVWYDVGPAEAERMASLAIGAVRALCIAHRAASSGDRITISAGVALATPTPGSDSERLLQNADGALYHAKREGRDRLAVAG